MKIKREVEKKKEKKEKRMKERKNKLKYNCTSDFSGWTEVANNV